MDNVIIPKSTLALLGFVIGFGLAGCGGGPIGELPVQWRDVPLGAMMGHILLWIFLGTVTGLAVGAFLYFLLRRWGAYRLDGKLGWWLRLAAALFMFVSMPVLGGGVGFWEGAIRAADSSVRDSPLGKELLPQVGGVCADGLLFMDGCLGGP